ncbi:sulfotransferase [Streptomyces odontomachi]|uniref:sulfotransferase n=1 Tax=Streptomyces odontomachi TaxID=2944940 RepID=UPI00210AD0A1|nr:sulfotransferase [Streptomyces sp. ODS25]
MTTRPVVVYLTGWCRSGTTLIGNLIGELPGAVHVGEVHYLYRHGVLTDGTNDSCGCGTRIAECPLWSGVLARLGAPDSVPELTGRQRRLLRTRHTAARLSGAAGPRRATAAALADLERLHTAIAAESGASIIVDSGKYPAEAATLCGSTAVRTHVLHVVRDPRAIAESWRRPKDYIPAMSAWRSTAYWVAFNRASHLVGQAFPDRYRCIRYEDFAAEPRETLGAVLADWGLADEPPVTADGTAELSVNHTVTGNPDRFRHGAVTIRPDDRWRARTPPATRLVSGLVAAPWLGRYGYRRTVEKG